MFGIGECGIRVIIRDCEGNSLAAARWKISCLEDPSIAEVIGIKTGLKFALDLSFLCVVAKTGSLTLASRLNLNQRGSSYLDSILLDCLSLVAQFQCISFSHVCRNGNSVAHGLEKSALNVPDEIWIEEDPPMVLDCILMDICPSID